MPGGYGTSGPWGSAGTTSPRGSYSSPGGGNVRQGSNAVAAAINEQKYKQSNEYLNDPSKDKKEDINKKLRLLIKEMCLLPEYYLS